MPVVFREGPYKFFFYSNEGVPLKKPHIHVRGAGGEAKIALTAPFDVLVSIGYSSSALKTLSSIVYKNHQILLRAYNEYFS